MSLLITYGTRPEWIKVKPLIELMKKENFDFKVLFTGQHELVKDSFFDYKLNNNNTTDNRLDSIIINCLTIDETILEGISSVLVQGDTSSVLGLSIMAMHRKLPIIHLEAGLRSYDKINPYPEEYNRIITSNLSSIHLCPTENNKKNLLKENIRNNVFVVGNTVLDNLVKYKNKCSYENKILITLHRRENHDIIDDWFKELDKLANLYKDYEFILPIHPNPLLKEKSKSLKNVKVIDQLSHIDLIKLMIKCKMIITDSGGIQEEASFFNKKTLVCRKKTERVESLGLTSFLIKNHKSLIKEFKKHINDYNINIKSPYGDGKSSYKIFKIIKEKFYENN